MTKASGSRIVRRKKPQQQPQQHHHDITLSDAAAARSFVGLSEEAARLVLGMVRVVADCGATRGSIRDAVATTTLTCWEATAALGELERCGLMQPTGEGAHRLHPLVGSIGHRLHEFGHGHDGGDGGGNVVTLSSYPLATEAVEAR